MDIGDAMRKMVVNLCRPRKECMYSIGGGFNTVVIGLKPTQKWTIIGKEKKLWTLKRKNVVITITQDEFIDMFHRSER